MTANFTIRGNQTYTYIHVAVPTYKLGGQIISACILYNYITIKNRAWNQGMYQSGNNPKSSAKGHQ